jgi:LysM repeat protein
MKILKIFGIVAGIHAIALLLIFANPGCSSSSAGTASPAASAPSAPGPAPAAATPTITAPVVDPAPIVAPVPAAPDAAAPAGTGFYTPTRPGTPAASALQAQPVAGVIPTTTYTVGRGDSLWSIAKKNHLKVSELAAANSLKVGTTLHLGQKLLIPSKALPEAQGASAAPPPAATPAPASASPAAGGALRHVIKPGETLGSIARRYGVKIGDLAALNAISDPQKIHPGQELAIPLGGRAPTGRAAKAAAPKAEPAAVIGAAPVPAGAAAPAAAPDLGAGLKPASDADVPVIKIEPSPEAPSSAK